MPADRLLSDEEPHTSIPRCFHACGRYDSQKLGPKRATLEIPNPRAARLNGPAPVLPAVPVSRFTVKSEDLVPEPGRNPEDGDWEAFGSAGSTGLANDAGFRSASRASSMAQRGAAANARESRLVYWVILVHLLSGRLFSSGP